MISGSNNVLNTWYSDDDLLIYTFSSYRAGTELHALRYILRDIPNLTFADQLQQLKFITPNKKTTPSSFISFEPGLVAGSSHFIYGVLVGKSLLIINPLGLTKHKNFYASIEETRKKLQLKAENVFISTTQIQMDAEAIQSCGPICVELMRHIAQFSVADLEQALVRSPKAFDAKRTFQAIDLSESSLIPPNLRNVSDQANYQQQIQFIRDDHKVRARNLEAEKECDRVTEYMCEYDPSQPLSERMELLNVAQQELSLILSERQQKQVVINDHGNGQRKKASRNDEEKGYENLGPHDVQHIHAALIAPLLHHDQIPHEQALDNEGDEVKMPDRSADRVIVAANLAQNNPRGDSLSTAMMIGAGISIMALIVVSIVLPAFLPAAAALLHLSVTTSTGLLLTEAILGGCAMLVGSLLGAIGATLLAPATNEDQINDALRDIPGNGERQADEENPNQRKPSSTLANLHRHHGLKISADNHAHVNNPAVDNANRSEISQRRESQAALPQSNNRTGNRP